MIRRIGGIIFPDALAAGQARGWGMFLLWLAIFFGGVMAIQTCFGGPSRHIFPWQLRMFVGVFVCYVSTNCMFNKLIANEII